MRQRFNLILLALIVGLAAFSIAVVWPDKPDRYLPGFIPWPSGTGLEWADREAMRLGLDLKGGTYVLLEADTSGVEDVDEALEGVKDIIERRVNEFGVAETEIQIEGANRLSVQLPGISPKDARELIGRTAQLTFVEPRQDDAGNVVCEADDGSEFSVPLIATRFDDQADPPVSRCIGDQVQSGQVIWDPATCQGDVCGDLSGVVLTGRFLRPNAAIVGSPTGPVVAIEFNRQGSVIFEDVTTRLVGYPLGIFLDDELIGAPVIQGPITGGRSIITGLDEGEARRLAIQLNAGALPVPIRVISIEAKDEE